VWIFTTQGFVSIVEDRNDSRNLLVRARLRGDIERLFPKVKVQETPTADYRFRASIPRELVADRLGRLPYETTYPNFKDAVSKVAADPHVDVRRFRYHGVWAEMLAAQRDTNVGPADSRLPLFAEADEVEEADEFLEWVLQEFSDQPALVDALVEADPDVLVRLLAFKRRADW
jgi:hypothetical protein